MRGKSNHFRWGAIAVAIIVVGSYLGSRGPGASFRDHLSDWYGGGRGFWVG